MIRLKLYDSVKQTIALKVKFLEGLCRNTDGPNKIILCRC